MNKPILRGTTLVVVLLLSTLACKESFLNVQPTGTLRVDNPQLYTKSAIEGLLVSTYAQLNGRGFSRAASSYNWVRGSISGGEANKGSNPGDAGGNSNFSTFQRFELIPTNGDVNDKWRGMYEGISRANTVLRVLPQAAADASDADKIRITAEARFLRAHYYFELKRSFNMVPYIDETLDYGTGAIEKVANNTDIWPKIEADFKYAVDNLPATQSAAGRANKWAAMAYLAKTYLYQKKYSDSKALFDQVIANGVTANNKKYALVANYTDVFNAEKDNNEESVFAIQAAVNTGDVANSAQELDLNFPYNTGSNGPAGCCGFFAPSFELANSFRTSNGLPLLDGSYNTGANQLKTDQGVASKVAFTPDEGPVDPRLDWSVGRRGIPYLDWQVHPGLDWIRDQGYAGPYSPKKFVFYRSQDKTLTDGSSWTDGYSAINYNIIRYADVLLMAAEVEIEAGSLELARTYVNQVRTRAANATYWVKTSAGANAANYVISTYPATAFTDQAAARTVVQFERKLELSGEGHRFYDLVRWNTASTVLNAFIAYESGRLPVGYGGAKYTAGRDEYMPIPQTQIDYQGPSVLKQNPGY